MGSLILAGSISCVCLFAQVMMKFVVCVAVLVVVVSASYPPHPPPFYGPVHRGGYGGVGGHGGESATGYGLRKALFTKKDEFETNDRRGELEKQIENGQKEVAKLKGMIEALKTRGIREREEKEEKHEEEIQFLLRINEKRMNQLHSILYS